MVTNFNYSTSDCQRFISIQNPPAPHKRQLQNFHSELRLMNKFKLIYCLLIGSLGIGGYLFQSCQSNPYVHGEILYENFCANCHMEDGTGLIGNIPPLAGADFLKKYASDLPCIIRYGIQDTIIVNGKEYVTPVSYTHLTLPTKA